MTITAIYGDEPKREGEYPTCYRVGFPLDNPITRIEQRTENLGEYGILWFDVFKGEHLIASANARYVAFVDHDEPAAAGIPTDREIARLALSAAQDLGEAFGSSGCATFEDWLGDDAGVSFRALRDALDRRPG